MADVKLVTKFVDVGNIGGSYGSVYGYLTANTGGAPTTSGTGTLSETANGSSNKTTTNIYGSTTTILGIYWQDFITDILYLHFDGNSSANSNWDKLKIGSTTFNRTDATYSSDIGGDTRWYWNTTNPFGTTSGADVAIEILDTVNTGHTSSSGNKTITAANTDDQTYVLSNASSNQNYRLIKTSGTIASGGGTGTVIDSRVGSGNLIFDYSNNELPTAGNSATYQLQTAGEYVSDSETESGFWIDTTGQSNSITITREAATATYSLAASPTTVNEGSSVTFTASTTNVAQGTTLYFRAVGVPSGSSAGPNDGDYSPTTGSDTVDSNGQATFTTTITADQTTEGTETFRGQLFTDSGYSTQVGSDAVVTISDTSTTPVPSYAVSAPASINEGAAGTITVSTSNVTNGTDLYWSVSTGDTPADFASSSASGEVEITNNTGQFDVTPTADQTTEGAETATVRIRTGSQAGTIVATDTFTINDTSTTPDTTPDSFTFTADTDAPLSASRNSNSITVSGLSTGVSVTVTVGSGGSYQKNGTGSFTSNSGTAVNGDTFIVQHTTSSSYDTDTTTRLTIGGVFDDFVSTTIEAGTANTGGGGGSSTGSGAHGIEVYGPDGTTVVWGSNVRQTNIVVYELLDLANNSNKSYTCADANDSTKVKVVVAIPSYIAGPFYQTMYGKITVTKSSTGFTVTNSNTDSTNLSSLTVLVIAARVA